MLWFGQMEMNEKEIHLERFVWPKKKKTKNNKSRTNKQKSAIGFYYCQFQLGICIYAHKPLTHEHTLKWPLDAFRNFREKKIINNICIDYYLLLLNAIDQEIVNEFVEWIKSGNSCDGGKNNNSNSNKTLAAGLSNRKRRKKHAVIWMHAFTSS